MIIAVACGVALAAVAVTAQRRPASGVRPTAPPPGSPSMAITDYTPRSTLIVEEHEVPRARHPVIDVHSHHNRPYDAAGWTRLLSEMDALNLRLLVNLSGGSGGRLERWVDSIEQHGHQDRMAVFASIDFGGGVGPGFGRRAADRLEADFQAGAVGLKLFKNFGLTVRDVRGNRLKVDDPELDAVWEVCARHDVPVLIHTGEPQEFFQPVDEFNERWLELMIFPRRRVTGPGEPAFEEIMAERDRLFTRHPNTRFIAAHMGWHANDLARLGRMLDTMPNVYVETGAILYDLGRQPRATRDFFLKYQDRILFGKDAYAASEYPYYWRVFETSDEYFDYYRNYHAFWKLYGVDLPDEVLKRVYYKNALAVVPGLSRDGFPD